MQSKVNIKIKSRMAALALLAFIACAPSVWADSVFCVTDDTQFAVAALNSVFAPTTIELVQGTYHVDGTIFDGNASGEPTLQGFSLLGGYTANCTSRQINAANTIVTRHATSNASFIASPVGDVTIEGVAFQGVGSGVALDWIPLDQSINDSVNVVIRRNIFAGGDNVNDTGLSLYWDADSSQTLSARIVNNLIHDNGSGSGSACSSNNLRGTVNLETVENSDATFTVLNNTIVNNGEGGGICLGYSGSLLAYNNILYGNSGADFYTDAGTTALLVDNVIGTHNYQGLATQLGTLTGNPKLNASFHPIESPPSPAINSGDNDVPGGLPAHDLDGDPRVVGSTVDRGAYESNVDDSFILTVTNTNDSGAGSLRAAINSANSNGGFNIITFAIGTGCGPHTITLQSQLPAITSDVLINGYSQTGSAENDLDVGDDAVFCIILDGGTHNIANGFNVPSGPLWVKGVAFSGFNSAAINLSGGSGHTVEGVRIGGSASGHALDPVNDGIDIGLAVSNVTIGGSDNDKRNIIGDAQFNGIFIEGGSDVVAAAHDNQIINNYIGVGWNPNSNKFTNLGNGQYGMRIIGPINTISNNLVGFNFLAGIELLETDGHDNVVSDNYIGVSPYGDNLGNSFSGIYIAQDAAYNTISGNTIADNPHTGIVIGSGQHNRISANSIYANGNLGIDLGGDGVTANDNDSTPPSGDPANRLQNFPVLTSAIGGHTRGTIKGTLTSTPGDYRIELFASPGCDASGYGQGEIYLGHTTITLPNLTVNGQTTASFNFTANNFFLQVPGEVITATAGAVSGGALNDTSEFSACFPYTDDTIFANGFEQGFLF